MKRDERIVGTPEYAAAFVKWVKRQRMTYAEWATLEHGRQADGYRVPPSLDPTVKP